MSAIVGGIPFIGGWLASRIDQARAFMHRYENLSYDQICEVTQWSKSAVESLLVRAYANLREKLKKLEKI